MNHFDKAEGNGIAYQDPWEYSLKKILPEKSYKEAMRLSLNHKSLDNPTNEQKAWAAVITSIRTAPFLDSDESVRVLYTQELYKGIMEDLVNS